MIHSRRSTGYEITPAKEAEVRAPPTNESSVGSSNYESARPRSRQSTIWEPSKSEEIREVAAELATTTDVAYKLRQGLRIQAFRLVEPSQPYTGAM
jgi:hypothetical protein